MDWMEALRAIRCAQLELAQLRSEPPPPAPPQAGANESSIVAVERRLSRCLPPSYRAMLAVHDGWPAFFHGASLFGVRQLSRGPHLLVARAMLDRCEAPLPELTPVPPREDRAAPLLPFGMDRRAETVFAWNPASVRPDGEMGVVLWTNEIGEQMDSFPALLLLVLDAVEAEIAAYRRAPVVTIPAVPTGVSFEDYVEALCAGPDAPAGFTGSSAA